MAYIFSHSKLLMSSLFSCSASISRPKTAFLWWFWCQFSQPFMFSLMHTPTVVNFRRLHIGTRGCFIEADLAVYDQWERGICSLLAPIGCVPHSTPLHKSQSLVHTRSKNSWAIKSSGKLLPMLPSSLLSQQLCALQTAVTFFPFKAVPSPHNLLSDSFFYNTTELKKVFFG